MALASLYSCPLCVRNAVVSSKYCTGNSVVVPSHAAGVKIGVSHRMKPRLLKKSRTALMTSWRTRRMAVCRSRPDPEVPAIHQVVDAVLLRRDRVVVRLAVDLEAGDVDLVAALGARVGAHRAGHRERRLLRQVVGARERLVADGRLRHDRLDEAGAVADDQEVDLAARPAVVQPAVDGDLLAFVLGDVCDIGAHHGRSGPVGQRAARQNVDERLLEPLAGLARPLQHVDGVPGGRPTSNISTPS